MRLIEDVGADLKRDPESFTVLKPDIEVMSLAAREIQPPAPVLEPEPQEKSEDIDARAIVVLEYLFKRNCYVDVGAIQRVAGVDNGTAEYLIDELRRCGFAQKLPVRIGAGGMSPVQAKITPNGRRRIAGGG